MLNRYQNVCNICFSWGSPNIPITSDLLCLKFHPASWMTTSHTVLTTRIWVEVMSVFFSHLLIPMNSVLFATYDSVIFLSICSSSQSLFPSLFLFILHVGLQQVKFGYTNTNLYGSMAHRFQINLTKLKLLFTNQPTECIEKITTVHYFRKMCLY